MKSKVLIIGGGLSGLSLAYLLKKDNYDVQILEANDRLGGRIYTKKINNTKVEMGATWLWNYNTELLKLCKELKIDLFEQRTNGYALFEAMSANKPQRFELPKNQEISYRISGGSNQIIKKLSEKINQQEIYLNEKVIEVIQQKQNIKVITNTSEYISDLVVFTIPPKLLVNTIRFTPSLSEDITLIANKTHTWMKDAIKFAVVFETPFWKKDQLSGVCFSHVGPFTELYDHTNEDETSFSLMGFINSNLYHFTKDQREKLVIKQLIKFFGTDVNNYLSYQEKVWRFDSLINYDDKQKVNPHENNGHFLYQKKYYNNKLFIAGSETSKEFPGYMEGAIARSYDIFHQIKAGIDS